jgi:hypothetical protein
MDSPGGLLEERQEAVRNIKRGANWFYWVAVFSLLNFLLVVSDASLSFLIGLGTTNIFAHIGHELDARLLTCAGIATLVFIGLFIIFGYYSRKLKVWAFVIGMSLYFTDALLLVYIQDWLSLVFHIIALVFLFLGLNALFRYQKLRIM